jgi:hypothetical protein
VSDVEPEPNETYYGTGSGFSKCFGSLRLRLHNTDFPLHLGFMMEMGGWGGTEIKTLQFLLPLDINEDVFVKLTSLLSSIFRTSNPIRGT